MFLIPLSLQNIANLRDPSERVPLGERRPFEEGQLLIDEGAFDGFEHRTSPQSLLELRFFWKDPALRHGATVQVDEERLQGPLKFTCSVCEDDGRAARSCPHQWATYVTMWQALNRDDLPDLAKLRETLKAHLDEFGDPREKNSEFADVALDSLSLWLDEPAVLNGPALGTLLSMNFGKYKTEETVKGRELLSPRLWNLPEIFRKPVRAYSEHYFHEVNKQNRVAEMICYNFSNGMQISSKEILRHPLQRKVPGELLPQAKQPGTPLLAAWPLVQNDKGFASQSLLELEEIMQALLDRVATWHRRKRIELFLQTKSQPGKALPLSSLEFAAANEVDWRVDFTERKELETEFALISHRKRPLAFFESFAVDATDGVIVVHPWLREFSQLQETLSNLSEHLFVAGNEMPRFDVLGEYETKVVLKHLRARAIPVKMSGESRTLEPHQSVTELRLTEDGTFVIQHDARVAGQKNLVRQGWTTKSALYLQTLSRGLPYLLNVEPRDIAARAGSKRDWDMKILKHLGILQYLMFETLSFHFEGALSDGRQPRADEIFQALHEKIRALLIAGPGEAFVRETPLTELCSRSVLACFEDFSKITLKSLEASEAFYSENGEIILEGVVEREFRLIHELLSRLAVVTSGEIFRRTRTPLLSKISTGDFEQDAGLTTSRFFVPANGAAKNSSTLQGSLETVQTLIPRGFKIFYNDQPLQELGEDEFRVDFFLETDGEPKLFNWFELNPKFFLRGEEVDPDRFLGLGAGGVIEYQGRLFLVPKKQMPSLRRLEFFWQKLQKGKVDTKKRKNGEKVYQLPRHQILELLALRASGVAIRGDEEWKKLCEFYDRLGAGEREELILPSTMTAELKPYQRSGVQWLQDLYRLRLGALLADDMGLGKTLQTLAFLEDLRDKGELGPVLIVVPSSLIFNWQSEAAKFTPRLPMTVFSNRDQDRVARSLLQREGMVVITTYGLLMEHEAFLSQFKWKVAVFDEAQNLKNITTKRTSAARALTAQFKICLTGTPMENHYGEFYSLVDLLVPGSLGKIDDFRRQFVNTELIPREVMDDLKLKIRPLLLRRTKKEILDQLPEKQETKISIAFEDRQKEIYRDIALAYNQRVQETMAVQGEASVQLQMLTALLRLRQACSDPAALPNVRYDKVPPKLEALMDSLVEIVESGESALVFTQFLQTLEHTAELLKKAGLPVFVLHGGVPTKQRQKILSDFNAVPGGAVLIMTLKTGGVGLNLTKASYVFHLEPWWNPSVENQATDRAHRLGQSKAVQVFRYIMHESLEEKIELLKDRKDRKFSALFGSTEKEVEVGTSGNGLSKEDFEFLLGLR